MISEIPSLAPADEQRTEHPHVIRSERVLGGVPIIRGTRIPVRLIALMYRAGDTVDDIMQSYPHAGATAIHDAISYYLDHQVEIEAEILAHRLETILASAGAEMDGRGFISFPHSLPHD